MDIHAWKKALILRGCPPDHILFGPMSPALQAHLDVCPPCREMLDITPDERDGWQLMANIVTPKSLPVPLRLEPGQVWRVHPRLSGWGPKYRYSNPPLVLILKRIDAAALLVAQVAPGDDFRTQEDVVLPGLGFAQPWNFYTLAAKDLHAFRGDVGECAAQVLGRSQQSFSHLDEDSFLAMYRNLEIEVGSFCSRQSISSLLDQGLTGMTAPEIAVALKRKGLVIEFSQDQDPCLELARYAPEGTTWGLAAADDNRQPVNYVVLDDVGLEIRQASIVITSRQHEADTLLLHGEIFADFARTREVHAWWDAEGRLIMADEGDIADNGRFFMLRFKGVCERDVIVGRLVVLMSGYNE
jgi:hypothetical protein